MKFPTVKDATDYIQEYALTVGKSVRKSANSGGKRQRIICTSKDCTFFVHICKRQKKTNQNMYISSLKLLHLNCTSTANPTRKHIKSLPGFFAGATADRVPTRARADLQNLMDGDALSSYKYQ
ncbi:hypothetical protein THRCLA_22269 [Thraustotheca clavata]|uniref:Transposase MuDR plant domain-containing protein n=1 Tax=Thraustotheca clavata TaxID=74557 RepID=A0A1V9Z7F7_9STRA|nr:hypothetical protein THRCLA_22269 [Thraustotheca clavata]